MMIVIGHDRIKKVWFSDLHSELGCGGSFGQFAGEYLDALPFREIWVVQRKGENGKSKIDYLVTIAGALKVCGLVGFKSKRYFEVTSQILQSIDDVSLDSDPIRKVKIKNNHTKTVCGHVRRVNYQYSLN